MRLCQMYWRVYLQFSISHWPPSMGLCYTWGIDQTVSYSFGDLFWVWFIWKDTCTLRMDLLYWIAFNINQRKIHFVRISQTVQKSNEKIIGKNASYIIGKWPILLILQPTLFPWICSYIVLKGATFYFYFNLYELKWSDGTDPIFNPSYFFICIENIMYKSLQFILPYSFLKDNPEAQIRHQNLVYVTGKNIKVWCKIDNSCHFLC